MEELLRLPAAKRAASAGNERYLRPAAAQRFSELAVAEWERDLNVALDHSRVATAIAGYLGRRAARAGEIEFEAWKNRSTIHRERGEIDAARASLIQASEAVERCADRELKPAIVWYAEAAICAARDVWEPQQALTLLERCEAVFDVRDATRRRAARTLRGIIHLHSGKAAAALAAFTSVAEQTDGADHAARADALRNVANALIRVGRMEDAERVLRDVREADVALGRTLHVVATTVWPRFRPTRVAATRRLKRNVLPRSNDSKPWAKLNPRCSWASHAPSHWWRAGAWPMPGRYYVVCSHA